MSSTGAPTPSAHSPSGRSAIVNAASALDLIGPLFPQAAYAASEARVMSPTGASRSALRPRTSQE